MGSPIAQPHFCVPDQGAEELQAGTGTHLSQDERPGAGYNIKQYRRILMRGPIRSVLLAALAVCAFAALTVSQASAATIKNVKTGSFLLAIYGYPGESTNKPATETAIGGGLGRNFGFGENMLFRASTTGKPGANLAVKIGGVTLEATDSYVGGTLMSDKTGEGNALSFTIQSADFQNSSAVGVGLAPAFTDTSDRPWITEICPLNEGKKECRIDPFFTEAQQEGRTVKIDDVSFNVFIAGAANVIQGTVWGKWEQGKEKVPPCIKLESPAKAVTEKSPDETLIGTQGTAVFGKSIEEIKGQACLISANNDWYTVGTVKEEPEIVIKNE
jgi:hypothetical protein